MKNLFKIISLILVLHSFSFAVTREEIDMFIKLTKNDPIAKQGFICIGEAAINPKTGNAQECIKSAKMLEELGSKNQLTVDQKGSIGSALSNAGVIYGAHNNYEQAVKMYQKAINGGYCESGETCGAKIHLGILYYEGHGVTKNHVKAYELFKDAAKNNNPDAQQALETLCRVSPWACK